jgi:predicted transcriptional regulator
MLTKEKVKAQIEKLPNEFSIDDLVERLIFMEKVEKGILQSERGEVIPDAELEKEIEKWFK